MQKHNAPQIAKRTMAAAENPLLVTYTGLRYLSRLRLVLFSALVCGGHTAPRLPFGIRLIHLSLAHAA